MYTAQLVEIKWFKWCWVISECLLSIFHWLFRCWSGALGLATANDFNSSQELNDPTWSHNHRSLFPSQILKGHICLPIWVCLNSHNYGKSVFLMGKSTINHHFLCRKLFVHQRISHIKTPLVHQLPHIRLGICLAESSRACLAMSGQQNTVC